MAAAEKTDAERTDRSDGHPPGEGDGDIGERAGREIGGGVRDGDRDGPELPDDGLLPAQQPPVIRPAMTLDVRPAS